MAPRTTVPAVQAVDVRRTYGAPAGPVEVLRGVDLTVQRGAYLALTGASGSGKSTLLNCLTGLDRIDGGTVSVEGTSLTTMSDAQRSGWRARRLGVVFQRANLVSVLTAVENVEIPLLLSRVPARDARERAEAVLERVGLAHRRNHLPGALSGGEQQRVAVARAVVGGPAVVWADEPTGSLDATTAGEVADLLDEVHAAGTTLVVVTHDEGLAARAQRRLHLEDGRLTAPRLSGGGSRSPARRAFPYPG